MRKKDEARRCLENNRRANPGWVDSILAESMGIIAFGIVGAILFCTVPAATSIILGAIL